MITLLDRKKNKSVINRDNSNVAFKFSENIGLQAWTVSNFHSFLRGWKIKGV